MEGLDQRKYDLDNFAFIALSHKTEKLVEEKGSDMIYYIRIGLFFPLKGVHNMGKTF